ncbi:MAG: leucine-rich repeat protein [Oscillospiraceae bacterium]|nr:leucine-rich repeat protein [Oscillospiraceae bacterium]
MRKINKKIVSLVLALALVIGCAVTAFAGDFGYNTKDDGTGAITEFYGEIEDGVLVLDDEDEILGLPMTSVADGAFHYDEDDDALAYLADVTSIIIAEGISEIGIRSFANLPSLESVEFKGNVTLAPNAFEGCSALKSVTFDGDAYLGRYAFVNCSALSEINISDDASFDAEYGALNSTKWFADYTVDFVTVGTTLVAYKGHDEEETIPLNITKIGASAFEGNDTIKKIILSRYVDTIGNKAFADSALEELVFDNLGTITEVGTDAFKNTPYFNNYEGEFFIVGDILVKYMRNDVPFVIIPNTVKEIAADAFDGCYVSYDPDEYSFVISSITVPASVTEFGDNCFALATFPDGTTYSPRIYAYAGTPAMTALENAGYLVEIMPAMADLNGDGEITAADARIALRIAVKLDDADDALKAAADVDSDKRVTAADARFILRIAVGLEKYTSTDLLYMPKTDVELLMAYKAAVKKAAIANVGYTKTVSNKISDIDVYFQHKNKVKSIAEKGMVNTTDTYESDTQAALDNLFMPTLLSTSDIKSATNELSEGKYNITIVMNDYQDAYITLQTPNYTGGSSYIDRVMPVVSGKVFYDAISSNSWFKLKDNSDNLTPNCVRKYALTYSEPTIKLVVDAETLKVESIDLNVTLNFAVDGRVNGIDISSKGFKTGDGTVVRTDSVSFSDFQW